MSQMILSLRVLTSNGQPMAAPIAVEFGAQGGTIGRASHCTLVLPDPGKLISREQARIEWRGDAFLFCDLGGNASLLNDRALGGTREARLSAGDRIRIGAYALVAEMIPRDEDAGVRRGISGGQAAWGVHAQDGQGADDGARDAAGLFGVDLLRRPVGGAGGASGAMGGSGAIGAIGSVSDHASPGSHALPASFGLRRLPAVAPAPRLTLPDSFDPLGAQPAAPPSDADVLMPKRTTDARRGLPEDLGGIGGSAESDEIAGIAGIGGSDESSEIRPVNEINRLPEHPSPPASKPPTSPRAPASRAPDTDPVLAALLEGLGLDVRHPLTLDAAALARLSGEMLRESLAGAMAALRSRTSIKQEARLDRTVIATRDNNPLKFFPDVDSALLQMFSGRVAGYLPPDEAVRQAFADLAAHELAVMAGMRAALDGMEARFHPARIEAQAGGARSRSLLPGRKARLWDLYVAMQARSGRDAAAGGGTFAEQAFNEGYQQQIAALSGGARAPNQQG